MHKIIEEKIYKYKVFTYLLFLPFSIYILSVLQILTQFTLSKMGLASTAVDENPSHFDYNLHFFLHLNYCIERMGSLILLNFLPHASKCSYFTQVYKNLNGL